MQSFQAEIDIIGINPYVLVPKNVLKVIFEQAGKDKGPIPVKGSVNGKPFKQTLVKFKGLWRLYINTSMLKNSPQRLGESIAIQVMYDPEDRSITPHPRWLKALEENKRAKAVYDQLRPSLQKEIVRYLSFLKTEASVERNVEKGIHFLLGKGRFIGRDKP